MSLYIKVQFNIKKRVALIQTHQELLLNKVEQQAECLRQQDDRIRQLAGILKEVRTLLSCCRQFSTLRSLCFTGARIAPFCGETQGVAETTPIGGTKNRNRNSFEQANEEIFMI
jgi:hypothetical protein